jgi:hypothetical protein
MQCPPVPTQWPIPTASGPYCGEGQGPDRSCRPPPLMDSEESPTASITRHGSGCHGPSARAESGAAPCFRGGQCPLLQAVRGRLRHREAAAKGRSPAFDQASRTRQEELGRGCRAAAGSRRTRSPPPVVGVGQARCSRHSAAPQRLAVLRDLRRSPA